MKSKLLTLLCASFITLSATAQQFYVEPKVNLASLPIGIVNPAVEIGFSTHSAVELGSVVTYNENFLGSDFPLILNLTHLEYRYYTNEQHNGFFVGGDLMWETYKLSKSYIPLLQHIDTARGYDWGIGYGFGVNIGYKWFITSRLGIEASVMGGWHFTMHEPYTEEGVIMYDMNASAEWTPMKAGIYVTYRFGGLEK